MMSDSLNINSKLGVLGGGQLGRMLIQSAIDLNLDVSVLDGDPNAPCKDLAKEFVCGSITDYETVIKFGESCDIITIEIENVNTDALKELQKTGKTVYPQPEVIELIKNKVDQKKFYIENSIPTAPFIEVKNRAEISGKIDFLPAVNKLAREGYDGRGVIVLKSKSALNKAFDAPGLLEKYIDFEKELAVIVARNQSGEIRAFPVVELVFHPEANLVEYLFSPADIQDETSKSATEIAKKVIKCLDMIGLLAVELFLTRDGEVLVNESAPRTHNSGHHTIESSVTSQFEQHLRAIFNLPLGSTENIMPAAMVNLLGEDGYFGNAKYEGLNEILSLEGTHIHLYGKKITKPFRKMGHVTILDKSIESLKEKVKFVKSTIKIVA